MSYGEPVKLTAWDRFRGRDGGKLTNSEVVELYLEVNAALPFLESNRSELGSTAIGHALRIMDTLRDYAPGKMKSANRK